MEMPTTIEKRNELIDFYKKQNASDLRYNCNNLLLNLPYNETAVEMLADAATNLLTVYPCGKAIICSFCNEDSVFSNPVAKDLKIPHITINNNGSMIRNYDSCRASDYTKTKKLIYLGAIERPIMVDKKRAFLKQKGFDIEDAVVLVSQKKIGKRESGLFCVPIITIDELLND